MVTENGDLVVSRQSKADQEENFTVEHASQQSLDAANKKGPFIEVEFPAQANSNIQFTWYSSRN